MTAIEPTPTYALSCIVSYVPLTDSLSRTIFRTITQSPNPLPKVDPTKLAKACRCLNLPYVTITRTETYTIVYAAITETASTETYTDYNNVVLEIETVTIDSGVSLSNRT